MNSNMIEHSRKYNCVIYVKDLIHRFMEEKMISGDGYIIKPELFYHFEKYYRKELKLKRIKNRLFNLEYQELLKRMDKKYKKVGIEKTKWKDVKIDYSDSDNESDLDENEI